MPILWTRKLRFSTYSKGTQPNPGLIPTFASSCSFLNLPSPDTIQKIRIEPLLCTLCSCHHSSYTRVGKQIIRGKQASRVILNGDKHYEEKPSKVRE